MLQEEYPGRLVVNSIGQTADGRVLYEVVFGNAQAEKQILIHAGIHAREYMTCMLVMNQLEFYLAMSERGSYDGIPFDELFSSVGIHLVPMVNPDGISISQSGEEGIQSAKLRANLYDWYQRDKENKVVSVSYSQYLKRWKANARGVDLNRNFDYGFEAYKGVSSPAAEKYKGTSAECEAESRALVKLTEQVQPVCTISYHATGSVIYWDYGQSGTLKENCRQLVDTIAGVNQNEIRNSSNDPQDAAGYGDWCVMVKGIPSATIEIGKKSAPLAIEEYEDIWNRNALLWAALARYAIEK